MGPAALRQTRKMSSQVLLIWQMVHRVFVGCGSIRPAAAILVLRRWGSSNKDSSQRFMHFSLWLADSWNGKKKENWEWCIAPIECLSTWVEPLHVHVSARVAGWSGSTLTRTGFPKQTDPDAYNQTSSCMMMHQSGRTKEGVLLTPYSTCVCL